MTHDDEKVGGAPAKGWRRHWHLLAVAMVWLGIFPYSAQLNNPNERTRVLQARALVADGTLDIGRVDAVSGPRGRIRWSSIDTYGRRGHYDAGDGHAFVNDVALVCDDPSLRPPACAGRIVPAKAPGAALLGVPALLLGRALGLVPDGPEGETAATWWLRYGGVALPMLLFFLAFGALLRRGGLPEPLNQRIVVATALGTAMFPYAISFVGHALAGGAVVAGCLVLASVARPSGPQRRWLGDFARATLAGALVASAVLFEYHAFLAVLPVGLWTLLSPARWRLLPGFALGAAAMLAVHLALHDAMFGSMLQTGHHHLMSAHNRASQAGGFLGIEMFSPRALVDVLFDPYMGLFYTMPWVVMAALFGFGLVFTRRVREVVDARVPVGLVRALAAIPLLYLVFVSSLGQWQTMNGWSFGPRYLVPALMPLAFVAALGWRAATGPLAPAALGRLFAGLAAASIVIVTLSTGAVPSPPDSARNLFGELAWPLWRDGFVPRAPWWPWLTPLLALLLAFFVAFGRDEVQRIWRRPAALVIATATMCVWLAIIATARPSTTERAADARRFLEKIHEGGRPGEATPFW